ncbi:FAD-dependent oxidoreductase [Haloplasma contractile]|uniref:1-deoxy-D-xylulose-5-phosphate reductoisomerase protein n=1 Tax=Haloplasma contractile SSD-17B TaxID=1033810 RepID=F7PX00_9MOLU|nr:FAD-dependent oxidoreductase [Haloplasma contractile]ERJ12761.1 1-deoxy-D-xylulose-5-phosphate reductoisomerase protein [Haloplasma contractile SSD-17B]
MNPNNQSMWLNSIKKKDYPPLSQKHETDLVIVGGGITGITLAYLLKKEQINFTLVDANEFFSKTTAHTTAKITSQHSLIYDELINTFGEDKARLYAESNEQAIDLIESIIKELDIKCNFERLPAYVYTDDESETKKIKKEVEAAKRVGIDASLETDIGLPFDILNAVKFNNQAEFHPLKYLVALLQQIDDGNTPLFEHTLIESLKEEEIEEDGITYKKNILTTHQGHEIHAKKVVIASHFPFYDGFGLYFTKLIPTRSYIVCAETKRKLPKGMYISSKKPIRSLRTHKSNDKEYILFAGENHKTGHSPNTEDHYSNLINFGNTHFNITSTPYKWSTQDYYTLDHVPYIGNLTEKHDTIYVATGYGKWGMTNSTVAAILLKDLLTNKDNPWTSLYTPSRATTLESAKNFVAQNLHVAKEFIKGKVTPGSLNIDLEIDESKVISIKGKSYGAYKDKNGDVYIRDITCTHLGCECMWNQAERTWDCPCHGSRYDYTGKVVDEPALKHLKPLEIDE